MSELNDFIRSRLEQPLARRLRVDNTSGFPGVYRTRWGWRAECRIGGTRRRLGTFETLKEAIEARQAAEHQTGLG